MRRTFGTTGSWEVLLLPFSTKLQTSPVCDYSRICININVLSTVLWIRLFIMHCLRHLVQWLYTWGYWSHVSCIGLQNFWILSCFEWMLLSFECLGLYVCAWWSSWDHQLIIIKLCKLVLLGTWVSLKISVISNVLNTLLIM